MNRQVGNVEVIYRAHKGRYKVPGHDTLSVTRRHLHGCTYVSMDVKRALRYMTGLILIPSRWASVCVCVCVCVCVRACVCLFVSWLVSQSVSQLVS